jgi:hypothetical protein
MVTAFQFQTPPSIDTSFNDESYISILILVHNFLSTVTMNHLTTYATFGTFFLLTLPWQLTALGNQHLASSINFFTLIP